MNEAQKMSPGYDTACDGPMALIQSFHLPLTRFHIPFFSLSLPEAPLLCDKNMNNLQEVSFQAMMTGAQRHVMSVELSQKF